MKELGFYSQRNKRFIVRISTGKIIWLDLHFRKKTGRDRLTVCQIWWSCQSMTIWGPMNKLSFLHCTHWTYCEPELNFYRIKPLKFGSLSITEASNRHWFLGDRWLLQKNSEHLILVWWVSGYWKEKKSMCADCLV